MPYKSQAQAAAMHAKADAGEIPSSVVEEFDRASRGKKLPRRKKRSKLERWARDR